MDENAAYVRSVIRETVRDAAGQIPVYGFHWNCEYNIIIHVPHLSEYRALGGWWSVSFASHTAMNCQLLGEFVYYNNLLLLLLIHVAPFLNNT